MTRASAENIVEVNPAAGIYTILMIVTILALWIGVVFSYVRLTSKVPTSDAQRGGYGLTIGDFFKSNDSEGVGK